MRSGCASLALFNRPQEKKPAMVGVALWLLPRLPRQCIAMYRDYAGTGRRMT